MHKIIILLFLVFSIVVSAQDEVAKDILEKLSATTKSYKNITVNFDFTYRNTNQNINDIQSGNLVIEGDNFFLDMDEQIIITDGESQWIYLADINEVQIMKYETKNELMSPKHLFTIYEKGYKYKYVGAKTENKRRLHIIDLFPEESNTFKKIELVINAVNTELYKIILFDKNGGTYTYLITSFKSNSNKIPLFTFNLKDYPDVEVIDLR